MSPDAYCDQRVARSDFAILHRLRFLHPERRRAITAVYAFCCEAEEAIEEVADPAVARLKLAWWRNEIGTAFSGRPQHPVALALQPAVAAFALPQQHFQAILDGVGMDVERSRYLDFVALERYCHHVAGVVGLLSAEIFGYTEPATRGYAHDLGIALRLTNIIRDVGADARRGRIYLPQDELARFDVSAADLFRQRTSAGFAALMSHQVARARSWYDKALAALPHADRRAQRPGLIMAAIHRRLLDEIERDGFRVLDRRIALTPLLEAWLAWKTSWAY